MTGLPAVEILGLAAAFFSAFSTLPQSIKMIRSKRAEDVSGATFLMLLISYLLWLIYGVWLGAISIIVSNILALFMASIVLVLKYCVWKEQERPDP